MSWTGIIWLSAWCRAPSLVRKTRAQLKEEAEQIARLTAADPEPEPEPDLADDPDAMEALDAFSALAGLQALDP